MGNKFSSILTWSIVVFVILGVLWFTFDPLIFRKPNSEVIFYMRLFLVMFAINTFAVLRLYNSIVQNTRFSIELRGALIKFQQALPALERALKNLNSTLGNVKASSETLKKGLSDNTESVERLTDKIGKMK